MINRLNRPPTPRGFLFASCSLILLLVSGCGANEQEQQPLVSVEVTPASRHAISQIVASDAVVAPLRQAAISPKISSTIVEFKVQRGSHVKKGQLLAILENKDLAAQAEASKGDFDQASANYVMTLNTGLPQQIQKARLDAEAAKSAFDAAQEVYNSRKQLYSQGAIPRRDLDSAGVALAQARSQNDQAQKLLADLQKVGIDQLKKAAQGNKESAEGRYRAAAAQLSYSEIRSPIDGVVTDRPLYVGDLATANQPILTVMDPSSLVAKAHVPQSQAVLLKVGDTAKIDIPGLDTPIPARATLVSPALDPGSTTVEIWVDALKRNPSLKSGMTVSVEITAKGVSDALAVPLSAVFTNPDGGRYVLLAGQDGKAHATKVQLGIQNGSFVQILSGLSEGDSVITSGGYGVPDGTDIQVMNGSNPSKSKQDSSPNAPAGRTSGEAAGPRPSKGNQ